VTADVVKASAAPPIARPGMAGQDHPQVMLLRHGWQQDYSEFN
jgi:hypothetical protein